MNEEVTPVLGRARNIAMAVAVIGIAASVALAASNTRLYLEGYLFAWIFWLGLSLGCLGLSMFHSAIRGRWALPVLRMFESGSSLLPLMALLFVPLLLAVPSFYPWADPARVAADPILRNKAIYLNLRFFLVRAALYFGVWIFFATKLNVSSLRQDETGDASLAASRANWGAPGMVVLALTVTFAWFDWLMSLSPHWYSTVYGFMALVGQILAAVAFVTLVAGLLRRYRPMSVAFTPRLTRDLGNMQLTFVMMWAYMALSQWLITYSANLPQEISYYLTRLRPDSTWWYLGTFTVIFHFFVPFTLLLSGRTKRVPTLIIIVSAWLLLMRLADLFWSVMPFFYPGGQDAPTGAYLSAAAAFVGIGGLWLTGFFWRLARHPLIARHTVPIPEALEHA